MATGFTAHNYKSSCSEHTFLLPLQKKSLPSTFLRGLRRNSDLCELWKTVPQNRMEFHFQSIKLQWLCLQYPSRRRLCGELIATNNVLSGGLHLDPSIVFILPARPGVIDRFP